METSNNPYENMTPAEFLASEQRRTQELQLGKMLLPLLEQQLASQRLVDIKAMKSATATNSTPDQHRYREIRNTGSSIASIANPAIVRRLANQVPRN